MPQRESPSEVRVSLLGGFALSVGGRPVDDGAWRLRKARTLVKLLALAPGRRLHREQALELLWPDRAPAAAVNNLHQALHVARRQLGAARALRLEDDVLLLDQPLWIDVEAFRAQARQALAGADAAAAQAALELYRGPLLPEDLYEDWTEPQRAELEQLRERLSALVEAPVAPARRRDNLPAELSTFVGRAAELDEVGRLLRRGPLLTLCGPAGAGKTRLAVEAAARARERFRDGVWLVELAPLTQPELITDAIATAIGLTHRGRLPGTAAIADLLAGRELLIVLDNCEHLIAACAAAVEPVLRGCPDVQVLATSREPLGVTGELVWRVPSLSLPPDGVQPAPAELLRYEAVRLFVERARAVQPRFALSEQHAADVVRICRRLDGMPLAIELAAARAGVLPPGEIARRLVESFRLLRQERRTVATRQQTLEAALDWSYRLLEPGEARLLRCLAVFAGSFGLDAAEHICGGDEDVVEELVRLVDKSLVVAGEDAGEPSYRLLEMVRQFARERLDASGETELQAEAHARWYARSDGAELRQLDRDQADLRAALGWLLEHDPPEALRLAGALADWWLLRGRLAEGEASLVRAVAVAPPATPAAAAALLRAVPFAVRGGDMDGGLRLVTRSLETSSALGDHAGAAAALHMRGLHQWLRGDFAEARATLAEAVAAAAASGRPGPEANATHGLAVVELAMRRVERARVLLQGALRLLEAAREDPEPDFVIVSLGLVPLLDGDGRVLRAVEEESQVTFRRVAAGAARAYVRATLALAARLEGRPDEAGFLLRDGLAQLRAAGDEPGIAQLLAARGRLATLQGDLGAAREALRESLAIRRRLGDVRSVTMSLGLLAELAAAEHDQTTRRGLLERGLAMLEAIGDRPAIMWTQLALGEAALAVGDSRAARRRLEAAMAAAEALGSKQMRGWILIGLADAEQADGDAEQSTRLLEAARAVFAASGDPWGLALAQDRVLSAR